MTYEKELQTAIMAARSAGEFIESKFDQLMMVTTKNEYKEVVTDLDFKSEEIILSILKEAFSQYGIISEESPERNQGAEYAWVVDPLDGTANIALGLPLVAVSIALKTREDIVLGVVYHVARHHHYTGILGRGSFIDNDKIHVSAIDALENAQIGHIVGYQEKYLPRALELVTTLRRQCKRMLDTWSPSIEWTLLAQGKIDALVSLGSGVYDRLAGTLIVREAGGIITDLKGNIITNDRGDYIVASNNTALHQKVLDLVSKHYQPDML
jgi:myo-inositol-1(or 4)-monophosphatase